MSMTNPIRKWKLIRSVADVLALQMSNHQRSALTSKVLTCTTKQSTAFSMN